MSLAQTFVSKSGQTGLSGLLEEALQDFFKHHAPEHSQEEARADRQSAFQALAAQAEACEKPGWDGYGTRPVTFEA